MIVTTEKVTTIVNNSWLEHETVDNSVYVMITFVGNAFFHIVKAEADLP